MDNLYSGFVKFGVQADRHASSVIFYFHTVVFKDRNVDALGKTVERFVDAVVDDLKDQLMETSKACAPDIHTRAFSNGIESL
jgi:hypothetical protein